MRGNGEGAKGTCWAPAPGVGGYDAVSLPVMSRIDVSQGQMIRTVD